ncbi:MAG: ABC transporter substrate-binding protein [Actinobacteria bacterium]|nr:ABC transporter substrate-binding protein [Actinomycetota bacterium]MCI0678370.1 ABC transporter substrate-binding protein [Actinomycetota bacterium]
MRRIAALAVLLLAACTQASVATTTTVPAGTTITEVAVTTAPPAEDGFPVTVEADNGTVTIPERPMRIVSLSATSTEILFEIGAGPQVVAVDDQSNYPSDAPMTDLSGFTPNLEAILAYEPDLVVIGYDPGELVAGLTAVEVPVIFHNAALDLDGVYDQIETLGLATGNHEAALEVGTGIADELAQIVEEAGDDGLGLTFYHELEASLFTVTSATFFGQIYKLFGMVNIADEAGEGTGYPQLSSEYVVLADPAIIFLANTLYGESAATVAARPGWEVMTAVRNGAIVELDSDVASRWGPRIVDFARAVAKGIDEHG